MLRNKLLQLTLLLSPVFAALVGSFAHASTEYQSLKQIYDQSLPALTNNAFRQPLTLQSSFNDDLATGEIYAIIANDFASVSSHLVNTRQWCDMLVLHINVKGCYFADEASPATANGLDSDTIRLYVGRNFYQPVEDAYMMQYKLSVPKRGDDYLKATLTAEKGPFGTSEYLLEFEAIPLSDRQTFIHFKYSYQYGFFARVALQGYLATLGRKKVGFTIASYDENKNPVYVKGVQGIVERNSMRYFLSIRAFLDTFSANTENWNNRINHWYQLALPYGRQLTEANERKYIKTKNEEFEKRVSLETAFSSND